MASSPVKGLLMDCAKIPGQGQRGMEAIHQWPMWQNGVNILQIRQ